MLVISLVSLKISIFINANISLEMGILPLLLRCCLRLAWHLNGDIYKYIYVFVIESCKYYFQRAIFSFFFFVFFLLFSILLFYFDFLLSFLIFLCIILCLYYY